MALLFYFGHMTPQLIQMFIFNKIADEFFRTGAKAAAIYICLAISTLTQAYLLYCEIKVASKSIDG